MIAALGERGVVSLGIDVVHGAVGLTRERGATALHRDVFDDLPGRGAGARRCSPTATSASAATPSQLLRRVRELLDPRGRTVVRSAEPGVPDDVWATLECAGATSRPFRWSVVGVDDIAAVADEAGLAVTSTTRHGDRWCAVLEGADEDAARRQAPAPGPTSPRGCAARPSPPGSACGSASASASAS